MYYFISTPHYIDHCRGVWSENICHEIPEFLFKYYLHFSNDQKKPLRQIQDIYFFAIKRIILTQYSASNFNNDWNELQKHVDQQIQNSYAYGNRTKYCAHN